MSGTETSIRVLIGTLSAKDKARLVRELTAESAPVAVENRIIRRTEAARLLARSPRAVDYMAAEGLLPKVCFPGRSRGAGFRLSDVQALIGGKAGE